MKSNVAGLDDEDRVDFDVLRRSLSATSSVSTVASDTSETTDIWPLYLSTTFVDHYIFGDVIGNGSYAEVRECIDTRNLERCAVKIVNKEYLKRQAPEALSNQLQEIKLLRRFNHPNIIVLKECLFKGPKIYIVLEYCTFVLHDLLAEQDGNRLCVSRTRGLFHQLMHGISYLQSLGIVHRDIKPQNLLITNCGSLKIIDFGVSQMISTWSRSDLCSNHEGSPLFQAPEVVVGQEDYAGFKVDIWSAGVTLYLMLYGQYPFVDDALLGLYDKILGEDFTIPKSPELPHQLVITDLLSSMLEKTSTRRASAEVVLAHPWLNLQDHTQIEDHGELLDMSRLQTERELESRKKIRDVYRSMTVLPYLHNHHFSHLPVIKFRRESPSSTSRSSSASPSSLGRRVTSSSSSLSSTVSRRSSSSAALIDPNQVLDERPIEWGTEQQYNLLKVPLIRANRLRNEPSRARSRRKRRRDPPAA